MHYVVYWHALLGVRTMLFSFQPGLHTFKSCVAISQFCPDDENRDKGRNGVAAQTNLIILQHLYHQSVQGPRVYISILQAVQRRRKTY